MMRHGGQVLVDHLKAQGVTRVFSVPGESFLAALDGLRDSGIANIVCRQEGGATMMAEAHGKLTGRPGVAFVTRGPGATNGSSGIHVARQDSTPLVLFVGQIARGHRDREAFQEIDYRAFFGPIAKWVAEVDATDRLPEYITRAFHMAVSGRPGPVVLALPEDMLSAPTDSPDLAPTARSHAGIDTADMAAIRDALARADRPLVVLGGSDWSQDAADTLSGFAEASDLPVAVSFRRQGHFDNRSPAYVGDLGVGMNPALAKRLGEADCLLILGARFGDIASGGYEIMDPAAPGRTILHVHPDPDLPGSVFRTDLAVTARARDMAAALAAGEPIQRPPTNGRSDARAAYENWQVPRETPGAMKLETVIGWLSDHLPEDAIVTNGAGNYAAWLHRYFTFKRFGTQLAPTSGSMGYGLPAAIAAKLEHPDRTVVCLAGDGCFQMTGNEFSTAVQHGAAIVVVVVNNGRYGTIRMHQERHFPGRVSGTGLINPDFAALARAHGGHGELVERTEDFAPAFTRAVASDRPSIIELRQDSRALSTGADLADPR